MQITKCPQYDKKYVYGNRVSTPLFFPKRYNIKYVYEVLGLFS